MDRKAVSSDAPEHGHPPRSDVGERRGYRAVHGIGKSPGSTSFEQYVWFSFAVVSTRRGAGLGSWVRELAQLTALFTSALIFASSIAVNSFSAKEVGHMAPSSRFAMSLKPSVAYLELNF